MGCCLGEDANLAAAQLARKLFFPTKGEAVTEGGVPAVRHGGWGARATRCGSRRNWRRNSVHKCPKTEPRGRFRQSVYTPASPHLSATAQQCTQVPQNGSERPVSPICVHSCVTALAVTPHHAARAVTQLPTHTNSQSPISVPHFWLLHYDQGPLLPIARGAGPRFRFDQGALAGRGEPGVETSLSHLI